MGIAQKLHEDIDKQYACKYNARYKRGECNMRTRLIKVGDVNPSELSRISQIIKGYMTASDLSEMLRVNPSTTSRILNAKVTGSVSEDTIIRLADMIKPEMGITREELFAANGYKEVVEEVNPYKEWREHVALIGNVITRAIDRKGYDAWRYRSEARFRYHEMLSLTFDMLVECGAVEDDRIPENHLWGFSYLIPRQNFSQAYARRDESREMRMPPSRAGLTFMQRVSLFALMYNQFGKGSEVWDEELRELPVKVSYVVTRKDEYDYLISKYQDLILPMEASLVYVNEEEGCVEAEFPFKRENGYRSSAFFEGQYFDDDDNPISEEEYDELLEEMLDDFIANSKKGSGNE